MGNRHRFVFTDWNLYQQNEGAVVYRPSLRTLFQRLTWTTLAVILIVGAQVSFRLLDREHSPGVSGSGSEVKSKLREFDPQTETMLDSLRSSMTEEEYRAYEETYERARSEHAEQAAAFEAQRGVLLERLRLGLVGLTAVLVVLGVLPPLLALREQYTIGRDARNLFFVSRRRLFDRRFDCPVGSLSPMTLVVRELVARGKYGKTFLGYRWVVSTHSDPSQGGTGTGFDFQPHHQQDRPIEGQRLPERVATFVAAMQRLTGLEYNDPIILDQGLSGGPVMRRRGRVTVTSGPTVTVKTTVGDDVPPEIREKLESVLADARTRSGSALTRWALKQSSFTYRDANGEEHTYTSPEEMPPHVREIYERIRREQGL